MTQNKNNDTDNSSSSNGLSDELFEQVTNISKAHAYDILSEQVKELKAENKIYLQALNDINNWPGNLDDSQLLTKTGANDAAYRGRMVTVMRMFAANAINNAKKLNP